MQVRLGTSLVSVRHVTAVPPTSATAMLEAIGRAHRWYFRDANRPGLFGKMLTDILGLTACEYGFVGEVLHHPSGQPYLKSWALTDIAWDEPTRRLSAQSQSPDGGLVFDNLNTLFGHVVTSGCAVIANDPANDPRSGGLPPGHPPMHSFLGLPLMRGDDMVGMVGVANRPGGFHEGDVEFLQPYLDMCAHFIDVIRTDRERAASQAAERIAREAAERQQRLSLVGQLASGIAHDMNNLVTAVSMQCDVLELKGELSDPARSGVDRIREVCDAAASMAIRLNGLRMRSPNAVVRCAVGEVLDTLRGLLQSIAGDDLVVEVIIGSELDGTRQVAMSESDLTQIMINLVSNGRDATNGIGRLVVAADVADADSADVVTITVSDDGPGIPQSLHDSVFDPFSSSKGFGRGLGLPTVRTLVEMAGGSIDVIDSVTSGATFRIVLPFVD